MLRIPLTNLAPMLRLVANQNSAMKCAKKSGHYPFIIPLILEYLSEHLEYLFTKKKDKLNNNDLQEDIQFWIYYFILSTFYEIPKKFTVRLVVYVIAFVISIFASYVYFTNGSMDNYNIDAFYRAVITFIAAERTMKYIDDAWLKQKKDLTDIKAKRSHRPHDLFQTTVTDLKTKKSESDDSL